MTNTSLERAKEIKNEIEDLRSSLSQISRGKLFDIQEGGSGCASRYGRADAFLAQVENEIKTYANTKLLERITALESEFNAL